MATNMKRFTVTINKEQEDALDSLKRKKFYNESQSEMIRYLISLGLKTLDENQHNEFQLQ